MRRSVVLWVSIASAIWVTPALATETPGEKKPKPLQYSVSLLGGYGASDKYQDDNRNRYAFALGGSGGLTLPAPKLYFGLSFVHFSGDTRSEWDRVYTNTLDTEFGYDLQLLQNHLLIRPQIGLGVAQIVTLQADNAGYPLGFHWAPGLLVGVRLAPVLISVEYRRDMVVPDGWPSSHTALFGFGLRL